MTWIETDREPSRLEQRLEEFRDPETGHIMLNPEKAEKELLKSLLADFRAANFGRPVPIVEVLAQIAEAKGGWFDFTETLKKFENKRGEEERQAREREFGEGRSNILCPTPRVREI